MGERSVPEVGTHVEDYEDGLVGVSEIEVSAKLMAGVAELEVEE